jgi:tRNA pseudouridine55 synthase
MDDLSGILPIDKPVGMTSHDVVDVTRQLYGIRRVGHTGTLDPAASGLLLILIGKATRVAPYLSEQDKTYLAGVVFGATSDSGDSEGVITRTGKMAPDDARLGQIIAELTGEIELPVPALASVRSGGKRRYELARAGKHVPDMRRKSMIHSIDALGKESMLFRVRCSSGTYIRALAEAIGEKAGCGAYLASLRREAVGNARVEGAYGLDYLAARQALGDELPAPEAIDDYLELPMIEVAPDADAVIHHGQQLTPPMITRVLGEFAADDDVVISVQGYGVAAVGRALVDSKLIGPIAPVGPILSYKCVLI